MGRLHVRQMQKIAALPPCSLSSKQRNRFFTIAEKEKSVKKLIKKYKEPIMYLVFGVATTAVNWAVYTFALSAVTDSITAANAAAWTVAVLFAFVTNKLFVFESKKKKLSGVAAELVKFVSARFLTGCIEVFLPSLLVGMGLSAEIFGIKGAVAKVLTSIIVIVLNYVFSKIVVFGKQK